MFGFIADIATSVVSILLPVFATYKALRTHDITTLTLWLIYWTTLALVLLAESQLHFFLRWVPFYSWIRLGVYVYLVAPGQKHGSFFIYKEYIHPFLYRHERQIDQLINEGNTRAFTLGWELVTRGVGFIQAQVLAYNQSRFEIYTGAPPGMSERDRRRQLPEWDRRQSGRNASRFEELGSDEDSMAFASRGIRRRPPPEDDLYFDGVNSSRHQQRRRPVYESREDTQDYDSDEEEYYRRARGIEFQAAVRDKEDTLMQSALSRIARARAKGKSSANLSPEEVEVLERRHAQQPETSSALATPPATPTLAKPKTAKSSAKSSNSNKELIKTTKKKSGFFGSSSPSKSGSKTKLDKVSALERPMAEHVLPYAPGTGPQGIMIQGPNGVPVYAPLVYGQPPEPSRSGSSGNKSRSRSTSKHARRESTPPEHYSARYYPSTAVRPTSASSNRSLPDDPEWTPYRVRSSSNAHHDIPPLPAAQGRRNVSGPADTRYPSVRRGPASSLVRPAGPVHTNSDPSMIGAKRSGLSREVAVEQSTSDSSGDSSDTDDNGETIEVNVDHDPRFKGGYSISRASAPAPVPIQSAPRRKKGRK